MGLRREMRTDCALKHESDKARLDRSVADQVRRFACRDVKLVGSSKPIPIVVVSTKHTPLRANNVIDLSDGKMLDHRLRERRGESCRVQPVAGTEVVGLRQECEVVLDQSVHSEATRVACCGTCGIAEVGDTTGC